MLILLHFLASSFGDPHITTMDGLGYSFNGLGDYVLYQSTSTFVNTSVHSRTCIAYSDTIQSRATVFCGFAIQETESPLLQVYLNMSGQYQIAKVSMHQDFRYASKHLFILNLLVKHFNHNYDYTFYFQTFQSDRLQCTCAFTC